MVTILRRSLIACCFCLTFSATFAQNGYEDVVYLKNGSVIHGMIIEQVPNVSIKIQTVDRNIFVYKMEEVEKMTKEPVTAATRPGGQKSLFKEKGYINITELNFGAGVGNVSGEFSYGLQTVNGYLVNPNFSIGFGIGLDKYKYITMLPLFLDIRGYFSKAQETGFFAGDIGYSLGFDGSDGGLLVNPALGVRFITSPAAAVDFSVGYRLQENSVTVTIPSFGNGYPAYTYTFKQSAGLINFKIGASF